VDPVLEQGLGKRQLDLQGGAAGGQTRPRLLLRGGGAAALGVGLRMPVPLAGVGVALLPNDRLAQLLGDGLQGGAGPLQHGGPAGFHLEIRLRTRLDKRQDLPGLKTL